MNTPLKNTSTFRFLIPGNIKSKSNGTQTILKSIQTKRIQTKGPFLANVPVQQMVKNYKETESKPVNRRSISPSGLVCLNLFVKDTSFLTQETTPSRHAFINNTMKNN